MKKTRKEKFKDQLIIHYLYESENVDWNGLEKAILKLGYSYSETYQILRDAREESWIILLTYVLITDIISV